MGRVARPHGGWQPEVFDLKMKKKREAVRERIYLTFPRTLVREPVLSSMAKQFDVVFNIRGSTVTAEMALMALEINGAQAEVDKAVAWLKEKGVTVEPIEKNVLE
jgi:ABC-type methionine transport system ATPase subunit